MTDWLYGIGSGIAFGLVRGLVGYLKQDKGFELDKLVPTLVVSGVAGALIGAQNLSYDDATLEFAVTGLVSAGLGVVALDAWKALKKKLGWK